MTYKDVVNIIRNAAIYVNPTGTFIHGRKSDGSLEYNEATPQIILLEPQPNTANNNQSYVETISFPIIFVTQDSTDSTNLEREDLKELMFILSRQLLSKIDENSLLQNVSYTNGQPEIRQLSGTMTGFSYVLQLTYPLSECTLDFDQAPTIKLFATQTTVAAGTTVQIGWIANNVNSVTITPFGVLQGQFGFVNTVVNSTTTYNGSATNSVGTATDSITITVSSGCDDATAILKDEDGNILSTTNIASGDIDDIIAPDGTVTAVNSDNSFSQFQSVLSGGTANINLPDITVNESDGSTRTQPSNTTVTCIPAPPTGWQRPSDWLPIPTIVTGEEVFYGLFAVYNVVDGNRVAFSFQGNYTVDWGDGSALEPVLSGVKAQHQYNYADVANPTSEGWRQALIKVIPTGAANLTVVNLQQVFTGIAVGKASQFMDIVMNIPNVTSTNLAISSGTGLHRVVERVWIKEIGAITTTQDLFIGCRSLQNVPLFDTSSVSNMVSMFRDCNSIVEVPLFNTSSVTTMATMFFNCFSLKTVPLFNTPIVTIMSGMFQNCTSLQTVPLFNTASVTTMASMFNGCQALQSVPLFNTALVNTMFSMFINCFSLQTVPAFNSVSVTTMQDMFFANQSLFSVSLNMSSVTSGTGTSLMFTAQSLQQFTATGLRRAISVANNLLSATELNNFFTSLGTAIGAPLIQVQGNPGASTCDTTIATFKGFTVQIV